ncbi:MAG: hypothetical protein HYT76_04605 [Deltaproteobacteria bacterium]|nr:hypothetical protein [Deltaproteobacteria bacterium]
MASASDVARSIGSHSGFEQAVAYLRKEGVWDPVLARDLRRVGQNLETVERDLFIACRAEGMVLSRSGGVVLMNPVRATSRLGASGIQAITLAHQGMQYLRQMLFDQVGIVVADYEATKGRNLDLARRVTAKLGQAILRAADAAYLSVGLMIKEGIPQMTLPCLVLGAVTYCFATSIATD